MFRAIYFMAVTLAVISAAKDRKHNGKGHKAKRNVITLASRLWPGRTVPYTINVRSFEPYEVTRIKKAIYEVENKTCITFKKRTNESFWVAINKIRGCGSYIGRRSYFKNKGQPLSLQGRCFTYSATIHEILHALGVFHEHVRPDRDKYLKILWENIRPGSVHNFEKRPKQLARTTTMYEYDSVMHYGPYMASKGFHKMTMVPIKDVKRNLRLMSRKNKHFTASDSIKVNTLYQCNLVQNGAVWSMWTPWSPCVNIKARVGQCSKSRERFCMASDRGKCANAEKDGVIKEYKDCDMSECYETVNGHWGKWGSWSACSKSCGIGLQHRKRWCDNPAPENGGWFCKGASTEIERCRYTVINGQVYPFDISRYWTIANLNTTYKWTVWKLYMVMSQRNSKFTYAGIHIANERGKSNRRFWLTNGSSITKKGDTTVLSSPLLNSTKPICFMFWYHLSKSNTGKLEVILQQNMSSVDKSSNVTVWNAYGDHGTFWQPAEIELESKIPFRLHFKATRGLGQDSYIAIDHSSYIKGRCNCESLWKSNLI